MVQYIIKRLLIFIPTLIAISLITFVLSINAPGDPVEQMLEGTEAGEAQVADRLADREQYRNLREELGLDMPIFYFSITNRATPDTLYRVPDQEERETLSRLIDQFGNWEKIANLYEWQRALDMQAYSIIRTPENAQHLVELRRTTGNLLSTYEPERLQHLYDQIREIAYRHETMVPLLPVVSGAEDAFQELKEEEETYKTYIPSVQWNGLSNQYHDWATGFIQGDFGISYQDRRPVANVVWDALYWTFLISIISMILTYIISIPIGVRMALKKDSLEDKFSTVGLFILFSLPNFWVATLLIIYFGGGDHFELFPAYGVGKLPETAPWYQRFLDTSYHLILPVFCWTYNNFAFLARQMRTGMINVVNQDYIRTAVAKGLGPNTVTWKHAFRNSLLPVITLFGNILPIMISGSVVLEMVFSIPGMGRLTLEAIFARNYPVVFTVVMFSALLTLVGYLLADILYAIVDPRISYSD